MSKLKQFQIHYAKERGIIVRAPKETNAITLYKLTVYTLFQVCELSLEEKDENPTEFEKFFIQLIGDGAPCEIIICVYSRLESKEFEAICDYWGSDKNKALQYAVIEYLTSLSGINKSKWKNIILRLLDLGADPNYILENFADIKSTYVGSSWHLSCASSLQMLLAAKVFDHDTLELILKCFDLRQEIAESKEFIFKLIAASFQSFDSYESIRCLEKDPRFQCIDEYYPEFLRDYILEHHEKFFSPRMKNDYRSLGYIMERNNIFPFSSIIYNLIRMFDKTFFHYLLLSKKYLSILKINFHVN